MIRIRCDNYCFNLSPWSYISSVNSISAIIIFAWLFLFFFDKEFYHFVKLPFIHVFFFNYLSKDWFFFFLFTPKSLFNESINGKQGDFLANKRKNELILKFITSSDQDHVSFKYYTIHPNRSCWQWLLTYSMGLFTGSW
jgi:hypothetical protein